MQSKNNTTGSAGNGEIISSSSISPSVGTSGHDDPFLVPRSTIGMVDSRWNQKPPAVSTVGTLDGPFESIRGGFEAAESGVPSNNIPIDRTSVATLTMEGGVSSLHGQNTNSDNATTNDLPKRSMPGFGNLFNYRSDGQHPWHSGVSSFFRHGREQSGASPMEIQSSTDLREDEETKLAGLLTNWNKLIQKDTYPVTEVPDRSHGTHSLKFQLSTAIAIIFTFALLLSIWGIPTYYMLQRNKSNPPRPIFGNNVPFNNHDAVAPIRPLPYQLPPNYNKGPMIDAMPRGDPNNQNRKHDDINAPQPPSAVESDDLSADEEPRKHSIRKPVKHSPPSYNDSDIDTRKRAHKHYHKPQQLEEMVVPEDDYEDQDNNLDEDSYAEAVPRRGRVARMLQSIDSVPFGQDISTTTTTTTKITSIDERIPEQLPCTTKVIPTPTD